RPLRGGGRRGLGPAPAVVTVPRGRGGCPFAGGGVAPPIREPTSYPATIASSSRRPSRRRSSATASAPGTTWIAGWPPPSRLPSSTSRATPAVAFVNVAQNASDLPRWPSTVAAPCGARAAASCASRPFSGIALPATMAPSVSRSTSLAAATVEAGGASNRVAATEPARPAREATGSCPLRAGGRARRRRAPARQEPPVPGLLLELARGIQHHLAAHERHPRATVHLPVLVGREARDPQMLRLVDGPVGRRIPDRQIGVGAGPDHALLRPETE